MKSKLGGMRRRKKKRNSGKKMKSDRTFRKLKNARIIYLIVVQFCQYNGWARSWMSQEFCFDSRRKQ
jgi:hypothetical protein